MVVRSLEFGFKGLMFLGLRDECLKVWMNVLEVHEGRERRERKHREKGEKREKEVRKMKKKC
jgi:hypothetical protein